MATSKLDHHDEVRLETHTWRSVEAGLISTTQAEDEQVEANEK